MADTGGSPGVCSALQLPIATTQLLITNSSVLQSGNYGRCSRQPVDEKTKVTRLILSPWSVM